MRMRARELAREELMQAGRRQGAEVERRGLARHDRHSRLDRRAPRPPLALHLRLARPRPLFLLGLLGLVLVQAQDLVQRHLR